MKEQQEIFKRMSIWSASMRHIRFWILFILSGIFIYLSQNSLLYSAVKSSPNGHGEQESSHGTVTGSQIEKEDKAPSAGHDEKNISGAAAGEHPDTGKEDKGHSDVEGDKDAEHGKEEAHGAPGEGYIGLKNGTPIDKEVLKAFRERVTSEAMSKGKLDMARFIFFAFSFLWVWLAFNHTGKLEAAGKKIRKIIDWYTLGTVTGLILIVLVIPSGIIITFFYMPTSTGVYPSTEYMTVQPALAFFRNLHNWSSEVFIWLLLLHAARTVSTRTFLGNRKFIWLAGAIASAIGWVAFLTGSFMRGDQEAFEGFIHMMYSFTLFPGGSIISDFFSGELTLIRLTTVHIIATIFIMAIFLSLHTLMRKVHKLVTHYWKKAALYSGVVTLFLVIQSFLMEAPFVRGLGSIPSVSGVEYTKPPWPIYFLIQGENWFGADAMVAILTVVFLPLIVFPYVIEFLPISTQKKNIVGEIGFYIGVALVILISYIAAAGPIQAHIS
ncbi:MAG: cytochrome b N-terminal domain-containing protein [Desulfobacula sp.]